ncbi:MAG: hypothetical protein ACPGUD_09520 [Parashewanella sp.]
MERLRAAQDTLKIELDAYNQKSEYKKHEVCSDNASELEMLLDKVTLRESIQQRRTGKSTKEHVKLKSAIADVLLLLDGFDLKEKKAAAATETESTEE